MSGRYAIFPRILFTVFFIFLHEHADGYSVTGRVFDYFTKMPVKGAMITTGNETFVADERGAFGIPAPVRRFGVRATGYLRSEQHVAPFPFPAPVQVYLVPFSPKAIYLTVYGIGSRSLRQNALRLIEETELNALVIDMKGDRGIVPYKSAVPLASEVGAQRVITVSDMRGLVRSLKEKGIYLIARIVVFKDGLFALAKPEVALKTLSGAIWRDRENLSWVDPSIRGTWDYSIDIALEAAEFGFDEIQFDYVRFPDTEAVTFSVPNTEENRVSAISGFLAEAKRRLAPHNVFLSADIFGYVCWNYNDTFIGQRLEDLASQLEYLSPMLYPSGFRYGIPGYRNPVANPHEIVYLSLKKARARTHLAANRFRPWLQAFRDYAFDRRPFTGKEIRDQIEAAEKFGSHGWMLWNPRNVYSSEGLKRQREETPMQ